MDGLEELIKPPQIHATGPEESLRGACQRRDGALVLCPLTRDKEEFVKETDIAPKRHLAFVANLFLQWKAVNQHPYRAVILGS